MAANGLDLADVDPRCDREVVVLFAIAHDAARRNDDWDRHHPERAAESALGGTDGTLIFHSLLGSLVEDGSFLKR